MTLLLGASGSSPARETVASAITAIAVNAMNMANFEGVPPRAAFDLRRG
jgi:hypothetical protein